MTEFPTPSVKEINAGKTVAVLDKVKGAELLASPEGRKQFILGLTPKSFQEGLIQVNGVLRGIDPSQQRLDGDVVKMNALVPPEAEDKEVLLADTLRAAQSILGREQDTQRALETVSLLFSGSMQYLHLFDDGNGRMSRLLGLLTRDDYDRSPHVKDILKQAIMKQQGPFYNMTTRLDRFLDSRIIENHRPQLDGANDVQWPVEVKPAGASPQFGQEDTALQASVAHLSSSAQEKAKRIFHDSLGKLVITKYMLEHQLLPEGVDFTQQTTVVVPFESYFASLKDHDIDTIMQESQAMRKERVALFIEAMENPDSFPIHLTESADVIHFQERDTTLHHYYRDIVREYSPLYTKESPMRRRQKARKTAAAKV